MIDISQLTPEHVGRRVVYRPWHGGHEVGTISSWNDRFVFVRYGGSSTAAATDPRDLEFEAPS